MIRTTRCITLCTCGVELHVPAEFLAKLHLDRNYFLISYFPVRTPETRRLYSSDISPPSCRLPQYVAISPSALFACSSGISHGTRVALYYYFHVILRWKTDLISVNVLGIERICNDPRFVNLLLREILTA